MASTKSRWSGATQSGSLWLAMTSSAPTPLLIELCRNSGEPSRGLYWGETDNHQKPYGRRLTVGGGDERQYALAVRTVSPRLFNALLRAPEDVLVVREFDLATAAAVMTKAFLRNRRVVAMVEGDFERLGRTGTAWWKMGFRRAVASRIDLFVANSSDATRYLRQTLGVEEARIREGWWLVGLPEDLPSRPPPSIPDAPHREHVFLTIGQLIPRKGIDLLVRAFKGYLEQHGEGSLWIAGDGPDRQALEDEVERLDLTGSVHLFGPVTPGEVKWLLEHSDTFVFPTLQDLIGRVVAEAVSVGTPSIVSTHSGAVNTLIHDGENGLVVDPLDTRGLADAMTRISDPALHARLKGGTELTQPFVTPVEGAKVIVAAIRDARSR